VREANLRIPYVEQQIKNLTDDDKEKGWEESFINEWLTLKNQLIMVRRVVPLPVTVQASPPRALPPLTHGPATDTLHRTTSHASLTLSHLCSLPAPPPLCY